MNKQINRVPSPECPQRHRDHEEHVFTLSFVMNSMAGARIDCPGMSSEIVLVSDQPEFEARHP